MDETAQEIEKLKASIERHKAHQLLLLAEIFVFSVSTSIGGHSNISKKLNSLRSHTTIIDACVEKLLSIPYSN